MHGAPCRDRAGTATTSPRGVAGLRDRRGCLLDAAPGIERHRAQLAQDASVRVERDAYGRAVASPSDGRSPLLQLDQQRLQPFEAPVEGRGRWRRRRHKRSIVDDSLVVKNQMPAAMATIAITNEVASGTSGTSPTPRMPQRNVATTDAIGLM